VKPSLSLWTGGCLSAAMSAVAIVAPVWTPHEPSVVRSDSVFLGPSLRHPLGTDQLGRDVLSNVAAGTSTTLMAALLATAIAVALGGLIGVVAALAQRWVRDAILAVVTVFVALPALLLALVVVAARGPSTATVIITVGIAAGASVALVTRDEATGILGRPFVTASRFAGSTTWSLTHRHLLRNLLPTLLVQASGVASVAIIAESTLSYLGLGTTPPTPSWGRMIASSQQYLLVHPLLTLWPAMFICIAVVGVSLLGDGLRERLDPTV
jgi:peptide/nickel transport system permease protein